MSIMRIFNISFVVSLNNIGGQTFGLASDFRKLSLR